MSKCQIGGNLMTWLIYFSNVLIIGADKSEGEENEDDSGNSSIEDEQVEEQSEVQSNIIY